jgi:hypothetical protein
MEKNQELGEKINQGEELIASLQKQINDHHGFTKFFFLVNDLRRELTI